MNTLGKSTTKNFFKTESGYSDMVALWKQQIANGFQPTTYDLLCYAILRGKDYRKGFTPITNEVKLANGAMSVAHYPFFSAVRKLGNRLPEYFQPLLIDNLDLRNLLPYDSRFIPAEAYEGVCTFTP